jgi:hypothetical protein
VVLVFGARDLSRRPRQVVEHGARINSVSSATRSGAGSRK